MVDRERECDRWQLEVSTTVWYGMSRCRQSRTESRIVSSGQCMSIVCCNNNRQSYSDYSHLSQSAGEFSEHQWMIWSKVLWNAWWVEDIEWDTTYIQHTHTVTHTICVYILCTRKYRREGRYRWYLCDNSMSAQSHGTSIGETGKRYKQCNSQTNRFYLLNIKKTHRMTHRRTKYRWKWDWFETIKHTRKREK